MINNVRQQLSLAIYRLAPGAKPGREMIYLWLVEETLRVCGPSTVDQICISIQNSLCATIPRSLVDQALERALKEGIVSVTSDYIYTLLPNRYEELEQLAHNYEQSRTALRDHFLSHINQDLPDRLPGHIADVLLNEIENIITTVFYSETEQIALALATQNGFSTWAASSAINNFGSSINNVVSKVLSSSDFGHLEHAMLEESLNDAFMGLPDAAHLYLKHRCQAIIHSRMLALDPHLRQYELSLVKQMLIFVDTNVVVSLLCPADNMHPLAVQVIRGLVSLGCELVVTSVTFQEILGQVEQSKSEMKSLQRSKHREDWRYCARNAFVQSFLLEMKCNSNLSFAAYIAPYEEAVLADTLATNGFKTIDIDSNTIMQLEPYEMIRGEIENRKEEKNPMFHLTVSHDALHMLLVHTMRDEKPSNELGPIVWLATFDGSLLKVQYELRDYFQIPVVKSIRNWATMVAAFCLPSFDDTTAGYYIEHLLQTQLGLAGLTDASSYWMRMLRHLPIPIENMTDKSPELLRHIIKRYSDDIEAQSLLKRAIQTPTDENIQQVANNLSEYITAYQNMKTGAANSEKEIRELNELNRVQNRELNDAKASLTAAIAETQDYKAQLQKKTTELSTAKGQLAEARKEAASATQQFVKTGRLLKTIFAIIIVVIVTLLAGRS